MTDPEREKIYIPTETEIAAIGGLEPGDQLVEYYSAAERLRIGYLATRYEKYNNMVAGSMQYADSERLAALGTHVIAMLNDNFEDEWNGAYLTVKAHNNDQIITKTGVGNSSPYPKKAHKVIGGQLRFMGEAYNAFNNYHDPATHLLQPLGELKFYAYEGSQYAMYAPVVYHETGESRVSVQFLQDPGQESKIC